MDPIFTDKVCDELRTLLAEIEAGQNASNVSLYEAVARTVRNSWPDL